MQEKLPLFVTRFSLSSRSAIGVQTRQLVKAFDNWIHFHWWSSELLAVDQRSWRLENRLVGRYSAFKRPGWLANTSKQLGICWWKDNELTPKAKRKLLARFKEQIGAVYVAPLDATDAARMRHILELLNRPFVVHFWDCLDGSLRTHPDFRWLIANASKVFCLSRPLLREVGHFRQDGLQLLFCREASRLLASPPRSASSLRLVLIGDVAAYSEGLGILQEAIHRLQRSNILVRVVYIGPNKVCKKVKSPLWRNAEMRGFARSDNERDETLSGSHIALLPGPLRAPELDYRSRYSIPSRILDFFATGLPIVGTVHPLSATAMLLREVYKSDSVFCSDASQLAGSIQALTERSTWLSASAASANGFAAIAKESQPQRLRREMSELF